MQEVALFRLGPATPLLLVLYYLFGAYVFATISGVDGNAAFYGASLVFLWASCLLLANRVGSRQKVNLKFLVLCSVLVPLLFFPPWEKQSLYIRFFALEFLLLFFLFTEFKVSLAAFSRCLNLTYLLYFALSALNWMGFLPLVPHDSANSFVITISGFTFETLYGIGGSTADIDSYSGLVLMWNLFICRRGRFRVLMVVLSAAAMLMTFRFTPIVALFGACLSYFFVSNRFLAMLALSVPAVGFISVLVILQINPAGKVPFLAGLDWQSLLWAGTHARSSVWSGQIHYYMTEFGLSDFLFGPMDERMTVDFIDGEGRFHAKSYNPHNAYLAMLFRSTVMFALFYGLFFWGVVRRARRNTFPVLFFISIVAYTNATIVGLQNPAFLLVIFFLLMAVPKGRFKETYSLAKRLRAPVAVERPAL